MNILRFIWNHPALSACVAVSVGAMVVFDVRLIGAFPLIGWPVALVTVLSAWAAWREDRRFRANIEATIKAEVAVMEATADAFRRERDLRLAELDAAIDGLTRRSSASR